MHLYEVRYVYIKSIRGQFIWFAQELVMSFYGGIAPFELALVVKTMSSQNMRISQLLILSPNGTPARQTFWELNRHTFHHLLYLHYFPFIRIAFVHLAFISFILHSCSCCLYSCPFILIACLSILMIQGLACIIQCL